MRKVVPNVSASSVTCHALKQEQRNAERFSGSKTSPEVDGTLMELESSLYCNHL